MAGSARRQSMADTIIMPNSCRYDGDGRMVEACGGTVVRLLGNNAARDVDGDWWYVQALGLDELILAVRRHPLGPIDTTEVWLELVSDGRGQLIAIADSLGQLSSTYAGQDYAPDPRGTSGITSRSQTFGPRRWTTDALGDVSTFRTREYDPGTGSGCRRIPRGLVAASTCTGTTATIPIASVILLGWLAKKSKEPPPRAKCLPS
jgi:hypothetical protein